MNRRTFLTGVVASTATTLAFTSMASALDEPTWDPASQLYGNMFGALGKAEDGKVQFVSKTSEIGSDFIPKIFGVLHNNTDTGQTMIGLAETEVVIDFSQITLMQTSIEPGGYGLVQLTYLPEEFSQQTLDGLVPATSPQEEAEKLPYADFLASTPLEVRSASLSSDILRVEIANTTDFDFEDLSVSGLVIWFDESGQQTEGRTFLLSDGLQAGSSLTIEETIFLPEGTVTDRFLIGVKGYAGQA